MKGGYQIIDLENKGFDPEDPKSFVIKGVYDKIEGTRKPIMITNLVFADFEIRNQFVDMYLVDSVYYCTVRQSSGVILKISINDDDLVTVDYGNY